MAARDPGRAARAADRVRRRATGATEVRTALHERRPARVGRATPPGLATPHLGRADARGRVRARPRIREADRERRRSPGSGARSCSRSTRRVRWPRPTSRRAGLVAAQAAARRFINGLPSGLKVGLLSFDTNARVLVSPTSDHAPVLAGVDALTIGGGTATGHRDQRRTRRRSPRCRPAPTGRRPRPRSCS